MPTAYAHVLDSPRSRGYAPAVLALTRRSVAPLALSLLVAACSASTPESDVTPAATSADAETTTVRSDASGGFTIDYPEGWEELAPESELIAVALVAPASDAVDGVRPNVNVVVEALRATMSMDEYYESATSISAAVFQDYEVLEEGATSLGGLDARWIEYEATVGGNSLHQRQVITVHGSDGIVVTVTASVEGFDDAMPQTDGIVTSLRFDET
jgi:hypothetical protein